MNRCMLECKLLKLLHRVKKVKETPVRTLGDVFVACESSMFRYINVWLHRRCWWADHNLSKMIVRSPMLRCVLGFSVFSRAICDLSVEICTFSLFTLGFYAGENKTSHR